MGGGGWVKWVVGIKECTCCNEHKVLHGGVESLHCTPETNITLYANWNLKTNKKVNILMAYKGAAWNPGVLSSFEHLPDMLGSQEPH